MLNSSVTTAIWCDGYICKAISTIEFIVPHSTCILRYFFTGNHLILITYMCEQVVICEEKLDALLGLEGFNVAKS